MAGPPAKKQQPPVSVYAAVDVPYLAALSTYFGYAVLIVFGYLRDFFGRRFRRARYAAPPGRAPLLVDFDDFYTRRLYLRIADCWGRPIASPAGAWIDLLLLPPQPPHHHQPSPASSSSSSSPPPPHMPAATTTTSTCMTARTTNSRLTSAADTGRIPHFGVPRRRRVLNLGSYNYLGFGEVPGGVDACVADAVDRYGVATCDPAAAAGTTDVVQDLEHTVALFVGKPAAVVMGMGFATNAQLIPAIVGPDDLVLSDALNHASIVVGARSSTSKIRLFDHNNVASLRAELSAAIAAGNPRKNGQPWARIFILVEGMYSMEGESPPLREIVKVKKEFKAYLFVDEAHSIGALGATGRGVCEHFGVKPAEVDILMGTFTKSFGAVGGYVAGSHALVRQIRARSPGALYSTAMSPPCARHIIWALRQIAGQDGTDVGRTRIQALRENAIFFRRELAKLRVQTLGDWDSPVVPIMLYNPAKIAAFSRECLARGLAVVVVGFPATPLLLARARICLSAAHTHQDLVWAISVIDEVSEIIQIKYDRPLAERLLPTSLARLMTRKPSTDSLSCYVTRDQSLASECFVES